VDRVDLHAAPGVCLCCCHRRAGGTAKNALPIATTDDCCLSCRTGDGDTAAAAVAYSRSIRTMLPASSAASPARQGRLNRVISDDDQTIRSIVGSAPKSVVAGDRINDLSLQLPSINATGAVAALLVYLFK
jgi:hypothetical protein